MTTLFKGTGNVFSIQNILSFFFATFIIIFHQYIKRLHDLRIYHIHEGVLDINLMQNHLINVMLPLNLLTLPVKSAYVISQP